MRKAVPLVAVTAFVLCGLAGADVVGFDAIAFRGANIDPSIMPTVTENAEEDGFIANTTLAGQKVLYGTDYFDGWSLSEIDSITFTFRNGSSTSPYANLVITDGAGAYGVISSQGLYLSDVTDNLADTLDPYYQATRTFYFAGDNGNENYGFRFYEPSDTAPWAHGTNLAWDDIDDWYLLGVGDSRPLSVSAAEANSLGQARGPVDDGLALVWGDSLANYLGVRQVWDVCVTANGVEYCAGTVVPEPATLTLGGIGIAAVALRLRRRRRS